MILKIYTEIREKYPNICNLIKQDIRDGKKIIEIAGEFTPFFKERYNLGYIGTGMLIDDLKEEICKESGLTRNL